MMRVALDAVLKRFVVVGTLRIRWPDGQISVYAGEGGPDVTVALQDWRMVRRMLLDPSMAIGEGYMDGAFQPLGCTIYDVLELLMRNDGSKESSEPFLAMQRWRDQVIRRLSQWNPPWRSVKNVAHHYDIDGKLYAMFLDADRQYSCAYFRTGHETLEAAQLAKKQHIAQKLLLTRPGLTVLDIGCGWGGMALHLAREHGAKVVGITLSGEQLAVAQERAALEGLSDRVSFRLLDYRAVDEPFDRIVSVGMFEHVGIGHYDAFFSLMQRTLKQDGVALLHSIGRTNGPGSTNSWIRKYIFPGGYAPALSEVLPAVERADLITTDIEIWRLHYAQTLRHWRSRFAANRQAISALYDERFCRMFEFYLAGSECGFRFNGQMVFQLQVARDQHAVPLTRDYITNRQAEAVAARF